MIMEKVKETDNYVIFKKRNGRYGVKSPTGKWINGNDKVKILIEEGLIKAALPKKDEPAQETPVEDAAQKTTEEASPEPEAEAQA